MSLDTSREQLPAALLHPIFTRLSHARGMEWSDPLAKLVASYPSGGTSLMVAVTVLVVSLAGLLWSVKRRRDREKSRHLQAAKIQRVRSSRAIAETPSPARKPIVTKPAPDLDAEIRFGGALRFDLHMRRIVVHGPCHWRRDGRRRGTNFLVWTCLVCRFEAYTSDGLAPKECKRNLRTG